MQQASEPESVMRFGAFELNLLSGELRKQGVKIKLQEQPFQVLAILLANPGRVVTRDELRTQLWPQDTFVDFEHSLATAINKVREALGDAVQSPRFIETLPRRGYRFIAHIAPVAPAEAPFVGGPVGRSDGDTASANAGLSLVPSDSRRPWDFVRRRWVIAVALVVLVVVVALVIAFNVSGLRNHLVSALGRGSRALATNIQSVAVLPIENLSHDPEQEYFADGMTDALITDLGKISALRVISRQSVMRYKGSKKPLPEIASDLNVDALVEGAVVHSGNRVRITAQLVQGRPERQLWAETYESDLQDVLVLQGEVARAIADEIKVKVEPQEQARLAHSRAVNPEAHELYLKGLYFWNTNRNQRDLTKAIELFQQATEKDPGDPLAYTGLSDAYSSLVGWDVLSPLETLPKAKAAATTALQNDDSLAEAHGSLGHAEMYDWDFAGAENEFKRAIQLNPSYATGHWLYALDLSKMRRLREAVEEMQRAQSLDPISHVSNEVSGWIFYLARDYEHAVEQEQKALELDANLAPARYYLGLAYEQERKYPEATEQFEKAVALSGGIPQFVGGLGHAYGVSGRRGEAAKILERLSDQSKRTYVSPFSIAIVYAGLGETKQTFEWLDKAFRGHAQLLTNLKVDPRLDTLRSDMRFQDLLRRMNFPP